MAGGLILNLSTADTYQSARLNNNDPTGNFIVVWDVTVDFEPKAAWVTNEVLAFTQYGASSGFFSAGQEQALGPSFPRSPGVLQGFLNDPGLDNTPVQLLAHPGQYQWPHDWPMFYIQPGQYFGIGISAVPSAAFGQVIVNFYWETHVPRV